MQQQPQSQSAGGAGAELRSDAQKISSTAKDRVFSEVDARKDTAANQAKSVSSAIQKVAGELDDASPGWLKSAFQQGAEQIRRFADTIETKDSRQLVEDVQDFARQQPALFLGACAAAGFAAARIFKAGGEHGNPQSFGNARPGTSPHVGRSFERGDASGDAQPWGSGEQAGEQRPFIASHSSGSDSGEGSRQGSALQSDDLTGRIEEDPLVLGSGSESSTRGPGGGDFR